MRRSFCLVLTRFNELIDTLRPWQEFSIRTPRNPLKPMFSLFIEIILVEFRFIRRRGFQWLLVNFAAFVLLLFSRDNIRTFFQLLKAHRVPRRLRFLRQITILLILILSWPYKTVRLHLSCRLLHLKWWKKGWNSRLLSWVLELSERWSNHLGFKLY